MYALYCIGRSAIDINAHIKCEIAHVLLHHRSIFTDFAALWKSVHFATFAALLIVCNAFEADDPLGVYEFQRIAKSNVHNRSK